jgi:hypothetical protein
LSFEGKCILKTTQPSILQRPRTLGAVQEGIQRSSTQKHNKNKKKIELPHVLIYFDENSLN